MALTPCKSQTMDKVVRILVHLAKDGVAPQCARFVQSVTGHFSGSLEDEAQVTCSLDNNRFILSSGGRGGRVPLRRAPFCPFKHLCPTEAAALPREVQDRGVDVGVAILLQSANQRLLLTRRAAGLRIFPNVWVPPGGHVEEDETLLAAGLRELKEETGLVLEPDVSPQLLGLWESAYPPMLSRGAPRRHHVVTYLLLQSSLSHQQLQESLCPEPAEVSACLWVDAPLVQAIVSARDGEQTEVPLKNLPQTVSLTEVFPDGRLSEASLPVSVLCNRAAVTGPDVERVSTGTKYALELWLQNLENQRCSS